MGGLNRLGRLDGSILHAGCHISWMRCSSVHVACRQGLDGVCRRRKVFFEEYCSFHVFPQPELTSCAHLPLALFSGIHSRDSGPWQPQAGISESGRTAHATDRDSYHQSNTAKMGNANSQMLENIVQGSNCTCRLLDLEGEL